MTNAEFETPDLLDVLEAMDGADFDTLEFGLVVMDPDGTVVWYNTHEAEHTGFDPADVRGEAFFETIGPCMNNHLVAQRFESDGTLDQTLDYVFTLGMKPLPVALRLLARSNSSRRYLAVRFP